MNGEYLMLFMWLLVAYFIIRNLKQLDFSYAYAFEGIGLGHEDQSLERKDKEDRPAWHDIAMFKKGGGSAPSPDPAIGQAALKEVQLGEDWLKFAQQQFGVATERQKSQDEIANQVTQQQLDASKQAQQWATEDRTRYNETFKPLEDKFIETANNWDSAERQNKVAAEAKADVMNNAALARQSTDRNMASMGVDPTSGRYAGVTRASDQATALSAAGAENNARNTVRNQAVAMKADAVNMGKGLAVNPATSLGLSSSTGSAAYGTTASNNAQAAGLGSIMGQGYQAAMTGYGNQANILNQQYNNQLNAWQAQKSADAQSSSGFWGGLGQMAGMAGTMFLMSSEEYKEEKEPIDGALEAIESMPIEKWKYKEGIADESEHIGPYAEDFQRATGMGNGKQISVIDGLGLTMKAIQELHEQVEDLSAGMGLPKQRRGAQANG